MSLGFCGAQRTGKSTLAQAFSLKSGVPFVPTATTGVFKRLGVDPKADLPFDQRLVVQWEILKELAGQWAEQRGDFVTDRTPLDMLAYTMADIQRTNLTPAMNDEYKRYASDCFALTNRFFSTIMVVQPGIPIKEAEGKAPGSYGYMDHFNRIVIGLAVSEEVACNHFLIPQATTDLGKRVSCVEYALRRVVERHKAAVAAEGEDFVLH